MPKQRRWYVSLQIQITSCEWLRIWWINSSTLPRKPTRSGWVISHLPGPIRVGCIWLPCLTYTPRRFWTGRCQRPGMLIWYAVTWRWLSAGSIHSVTLLYREPSWQEFLRQLSINVWGMLFLRHWNTTRILLIRSHSLRWKGWIGRTHSVWPGKSI